MIFSKFFKAKWQHKDSNIRIAAINDELTLESKAHKDILNSLVQQDDNELVRRTALIKLADFECWQHESKHNSHKKIKEYAQKQVVLILSNNHAISLSEEAKLQFIANEKSIAGLETWLSNESNEKIIIALFNKIEKPQLLNSVFAQKQQPIIQRYLLSKVSDKPQLEKLIKKACNEDIKDEINAKITEIERVLAQPKIISKKAQLNLSKFLALTDVVDYGVMLNKKEQLMIEWQLLLTEFDCLTLPEKEEFINKHVAIENQLEKLFAPKAEAYHQQLIAEKLEQDQKDSKNFFITEIEKISQSLTSSIFEHAEVDETLFDLTCTRINQQINDSVLAEPDKQHFLTLLTHQKQKLTQLPEIAQSVTEATKLIAKISQLALPSNASEFVEREPIFTEWLSQWQTVEKQSLGELPASITSAQKEIHAVWKSGLAPFYKDQKSKLTQVQKKITELKRIISSGKYNIAFGVFKRIEKTVSQLSEKQKAKIQKEFDVVTEKMAELSDWESYIATPRKQQLLEDIKNLVNTPLDNPNKQAEKVKEFRTKWNLLGHADDGLESKLNNEFNDYCEQAFAPCRLFYKEQEKIREQNLAARLIILEELNVFTQSYTTEPIDTKSIEIKLNKFNQQWQNAGVVEREKYKKIQGQYNLIVEPIKKLLHQHHNENAALKTKLIEEAKSIAQTNDITAAIQSIKKLQAQWKTVGYSGAKLENRLWKEFRTINDVIFTKREQLNQENKEQQKTLLDQLNTQLDDLYNIVKSETVVTDLENSKRNAQSILSQTLNIKPVNKNLMKKIEICVSDIDQKIVQIKQDTEKVMWQSIFSLLENFCANVQSVEDITTSDAFNTLPTAWKKRLKDVMQKEKQVERYDETLVLEILAGKDSPQAFKEQRMKVQVKLMQEQMLSGHSMDVNENLILWLQKGALNQTDTALLQRIKPIFC